MVALCALLMSADDYGHDGPMRCTKQRFESETAARKATKSKHHRGVRLYVYPCQWCGPGVWHMTKSKGGTSR